MKKIKTSFTIYLKAPSFFESVFCYLEHSQFRVVRIGDDDKKIFATKKVENCIDAANLQYYISNLDGVKIVIPLYEYTNEKVAWYKTSIIPIVLSALITALTILAIVYPLQEVDNIYKSLSIIIPTSITIFLQIIYKYFREEPII